MMKLLRILFILIIANSISNLFDGLEATNEINLLDVAAGTEAEDNEHTSPIGKKLDPNLPIEIYVDDKQMREAFRIVDKYLSQRVNKLALDPNIEEAKSLIKHEMRFAKKPALSPCGMYGRIFCVSRQLKSKDSDQLINALLKIAQLERTTLPDTKCDVATTSILDDSNRWANDPIGRRQREQTDTLGYLDLVITAAALRRAKECLPRYRSEIKEKGSVYGHAWMKIYWNRILDHRFKKLNAGHCEREIMVESVFRMPPKERQEFFDKMPSALERDEVEITLRMFDDAAAKSSKVYHRNERDKRIDKFETLLLKPCSNYVVTMRRTFESMDFDMRMKKFLPESIVASIQNDDLIVRQRAYYSLCQKLMRDKLQYKKLLISVG